MTMLKLRALAAASALALAACSQGSSDYAAAPAESIAVTGSSRAAYESDAAVSSPAPPPGPNGEAANAGVMLAYSYSMAIEAPKTAIAVLAKAHEKACLDAGPSVCQVMGSSINAYGEDQVSAYLTLRAEPKWLATFRGSIASDAEKAGGELTANTVSAEDLTQFIIDVSARLDAKKTLRERIKTLLETREGSLNDILAAERALAEVQGEIDSMTASLDAAKARVSMSALSINYTSDPETSVSMWKPLSEAFSGFGRTSMQSLADAVNFVARSWPSLILLLVVLTILRSWWRGRRKAA
ncbi:MAG: DUF4349 domain-containing protein [Parvularculaceae bacterium]|nr:DUF4349 domain-containing protein [Parvularculaceae bacterium]